MAYPEEFGLTFVDHTHDGVTIRIVDISDALARWLKNSRYHLNRNLSARPESEIRKVLIHQHDGSVEHTGTDEHGDSHKTRDGLPIKLLGTGRFHHQRNLRGMAYHFDIPYFDEFVEGKRIVYQGQRLDLSSNHTGERQNEIGIGISLMGSLRNALFPRGSKGTPEGGIPSRHQRAALPALIHYLQERYKIADCHVQGHFQHNQDIRRGCPGYDTERWILEHEDRERRFCYPVNLGPENTPPFLDNRTGQDSRCRAYMTNTLAGRSGFYPFGRRFFWHGGVHLFPEGGENSPVYAVRDGWIIAARVGSRVMVDGRDYGSGNFILIQHSDPGLRNNRDQARSLSPANSKGIRHLNYFSLYMHLAPLSNSTNLPWLAMFRSKDPEGLRDMFASPQTARRLDPLALPVKTGEVIGHVGWHDPFAGRVAGMSDPIDGHNAVLHFEMFSPEKYLLQPPAPGDRGGSLLQFFDPDRNLHEDWTINDTDPNALAENAGRKLSALPAFSGEAMARRIDELEANLDAEDPAAGDPGQVYQADPEMNDLLSRVVTRHVSEWKAEWRSVLTRNQSQWGLTREMIDHHVRVVEQFQWWDQVITSQGHFPKRTSLAPNTKPYFYHPIRLLNWLNGLARTIVVPLGHAYGSNQAFDPARDFDRYDWQWQARFPWTTRVL
jgi:hypothetical protein